MIGRRPPHSLPTTATKLAMAILFLIASMMWKSKSLVVVISC